MHLEAMIGRIKCHGEVVVDDGRPLCCCGGTGDGAKGGQDRNKFHSGKGLSHGVTSGHEVRLSH
jgi:hypothetical protein